MDDIDCDLESDSSLPQEQGVVSEDLEGVTQKRHLVLKELSVQDKQKRLETLLELQDEPISSHLHAYFEGLKDGSPTWDIDTFIEALKRFANLIGPDRAKHYENALSGIHFANTFTELWNRTYSELPITVWDLDIRHQCPSDWSNALQKDYHGALVYHGDAPLSHALNKLVQGPTTLDCGMWVQLAKWMAIRHLIGDGLFDELFKFEPGKFIITQCWDKPMNNLGTVGNLLYFFYDGARLGRTVYPSETHTRIQTRTVFNHPAYLSKHPGGVGRLQNVIQIDGKNIIGPGAHRVILSATELEERSIEAYNRPQDLADEEKIWLYTTFPHFVHPDFAPKTWGALAKEAKYYADDTLGEVEWKDSQADREKEADGLHLMFNFQRLITCLEGSKEAHVNGAMDEDVLSRAMKLKYLHEVEALADMSILPAGKGANES